MTPIPAIEYLPVVQFAVGWLALTGIGWWFARRRQE
jgi:hypothetical protein